MARRKQAEIVAAEVVDLAPSTAVEIADGTLTAQDLAHLMRSWQRALRLEDWDLSIGWARFFEIGRHAQGDCEIFPDKKQAHIRVLVRDDMGPETLGAEEVETTIIHELLHVLMIGFTPEADTPEALAQEQSINVLARLLRALA